MAGVVSLLNQSQRRVQFIQNSNTVITVDCMVNEKHSRKSQPTEFEVEDGSTVSDHVILKPFSLSLTGIISDTPINLATLANSALTTAVSAVAPPLGVIGVAAGLSGVALAASLFGAKNPSVQAYNQLLGLQEARKPFDVVTTLKRYANMWISDLGAPRAADTGRVLLFELELTQLLLVTPLTVNIVKYASPDLAAKQVDKGKQEGLNLVSFTKKGIGDANALLSGSLPK